MREIKFRGKRIDDGRWVYGQYFVAPLTDENSGTMPDVGWFFLSGEPRFCIVQDSVSFVIDLETLGQYTNLKDGKGCEIYEGDIVKAFSPGVDEEEGNNEVIFVDGCFKLSKAGVDNFPLGSYRASEVEVVGNIFDHPELKAGGAE